MLSTPTIPGKTINELIEYWASTPKRNIPAFVCFGADGKRRSLNRAEVYRLSSAFAYRLSSLFGVVSGDIVCIALPNSLERIICDMGVLLAGATSMNGQISRADGHDFLHSLKLSKAKYIITDPGVKNGAWQFLKGKIENVSQGVINHDSLPDLNRVILCERDDHKQDTDFLSQLRLSKTSLNIAVSPMNVASVMTTSGSTGYSKLVPFTHSNLCHFCLQVKAIEPLKEGDHFINCAPLGWAGGYPQWYLGCGVTRFFIDLHDGPPSDMPTFIWNIMTSEKIVYGFMSPVAVSVILNTPALWENADWKPKILCLAGQPINRGHLQIIGKLCQAVDINYGITECNLVSTHRITDATSFENGCAGFPGYGVTVKVVDKDKREIPKGTVGEILMQSPSLTPGYLNNDAANKAAFTSDGWLSTDDAGYIDSHTGKLHVEGRQSDSIMHGSYVLYPGWLEQIIRKVDGVKDVVLVPVPDKVLHNEICACVVTDIPVNQAVAGSVKLKDATGKESTTQDAAGLPQHIYHNGSPLLPGEKINKENNFDDVDQTHIYRSAVSKKGNEIFPSGLSNGSPKSQRDLEGIRKCGMKKPLNVAYNLTSVKPDFVKTEDCIQAGLPNNDGFKTKPNEFDNHQLMLLKLEEEIRKHCYNSQILEAKDAMRMEPHYYVFFDNFAVTNTGKISRKETRKLALSALTNG